MSSINNRDAARPRTTGAAAAEAPDAVPTLRYEQRVVERDRQFRIFWDGISRNTELDRDFRSHAFPLSRIRRIMRSSADVGMVASDCTVLVAKACELFISELIFRAWMQSVTCGHPDIQGSDVAMAIARCDIFAFLANLLPQWGIAGPVGGARAGFARVRPYPGLMIGAPAARGAGGAVGADAAAGRGAEDDEPARANN